MVATRRSLIGFLLFFLCDTVAGAPPRSHELTDSYTFAHFVSDFGRTYEEGSDEWKLRKSVFEENLNEILKHNRRFYNDDEEDSPTYTMGINHLTDQRAEDLNFGYVRGPRLSSLGVQATNSTAVDRRLGTSALPFTNDPASELPKHVDWRKKGVVTPIKNQAYCGSCWAFATTEVTESHVAIKTGTLMKLSTQELVNCVKNDEHCGGTGGCEGATAELGFDYIIKNGLKKEIELPYTSKDGTCDGVTLRGRRHHHKSHNKSGSASITGYASVPANDYLTTLNAVAKTGPVAVSVDGNSFRHYEGGVMDSIETTLDHAVVIDGYGTDKKTGLDYWLVRNSWGTVWGEDGYIRVKRESDPPCGMDKKPEVGYGCTLDKDGKPIDLDPLKVCGTCGILADVLLPVGAHVL